MNLQQLEKYNKMRSAIVKKYRTQKIKSIAIILSIAIIAVIADVIIYSLGNNIAIALVVGAMIIMFSIIYMRIRIVTVNHAMQQKLQLFEQDFELYDKNQN